MKRPNADDSARGVTDDPILSVAQARRAANESGRYLLWLHEGEAALFREPGWLKLDRARDGGVLFVHPEREIRAARQRGIL
jgi:hypothetical protein